MKVGSMRIGEVVTFNGEDDRSKLPIGGYIDDMLWGKIEDPETGDYKKYGLFPTTRYRNILNRPRVITQDTSISGTANADFHLVVTGMEEMLDEEAFALFGQAW